MTDTKHTENGGPAFPEPYTCLHSDDLISAAPGMSLRDWFAGQVVGSIIQANVTKPLYEHGNADTRKTNEWCGTEAYRVADAMIKARGES